MEDSSLFMEWAMETLQHLHPPPPPPSAGGYGGGGADTFPSLQALRESASQNGMAPPEPAAHEGHRATNSWSSGDTDSPSNEVATARNVPAARAPAVSPPTRRASAKGGAGGGGGGTGSSSSAPYAQEHIIAERKRREKINQRFIELSTVIPGLKKMDKATILSDAVRYVKELQEKLSELEDQNGRSVESAVLVKKPCIAAASDGRPSSPATVAGSSSSSGSCRRSLPEIEAKISHGNLMVRIHCENGKGLLVRLLAEVEGLHLAITHTNVMPFPACTAIITIMAKVEDGFSVTAEDIVGRLNAVLQQHHSRNSAEEKTSCQQQEAATC
uniref:BHLH domain-containing protein n=1 Tax=Leersia perrieri TaxID=77586 RepID=A0A0D9VXA1_9ORYZ